MKKVLIALDYSTSAKKIAETGYSLAKAMNAEVTLVHVIMEPVYYDIGYSPIMGYQGGYTDGIVPVVSNIKKEANGFLAATVKHLGDDRIKTKAISGNNTEDAILKYCKSRKIDLIVMGSHKHKGLERLFVPDTAVHMVKHSTIPLFIIPTKE
jgi:nucleotide-binding universal stress UspA family protein